MKGRYQPTNVGNMVHDANGGYVCYWDYEEQHKILRECYRAIDELLAKKPMQAGLLCGSTTLGNLLNDLRAATNCMSPNELCEPTPPADMYEYMTRSMK